MYTKVRFPIHVTFLMYMKMPFRIHEKACGQPFNPISGLKGWPQLDLVYNVSQAYQILETSL